MADTTENNVTPEGRILIKSMEDVMSESMLPYSEYVILDRALPRVEDGLKPVQRRILFTMSELGIRPDTPYPQVRAHSGRLPGQVPPARRQLGVRRARQTGAALQHERASRGRSGQLRLDRRRRSRGDAIHRGPGSRRSRSSCCAIWTRTPCAGAATSTTRSKNLTCCPGAFPTCSSTARAA